MWGKNLLSYFSAQTINYGDSKEPSLCCFGALEYSKHILKWMDKRIFSYIFLSSYICSLLVYGQIKLCGSGG